MSTGRSVTPSARTASTGRLIGVDVARALALLGMVTAHTTGALDPEATGGVDPVFQLVTGRSAALFAVLAGVSLALTTRDAPGFSDRGRLTAYRLQVLTRAVLIALLGLVLGVFPSGVAVILTYYGVLFLAALPVLRWSARSLMLLAIGWGLLSPVLSMLVRPLLPAPTYTVPTPLSLLDPLRLIGELTVTGYYPVLTWCTYLFAGMALGRADLRRVRQARAVLLGGALLAVGALGVSSLVTRSPAIRADLVDGAPPSTDPTTWAQLDTALREGLPGSTPTEPWTWLLIWSPHSGSIVDLAHTTGVALAVLGGCVWLLGLLPRRVRRGLQIVFGAGTMTLTLYVAHVAVLAAPEGLPLVQSTVAHLLTVLVLGAVFVATRSRGPLETWVSQTSAAAGGRGPRPDPPG